MNRTIIALYDDLPTAQQVVTELVADGFDRDSISLMANDASNEYGQYLGKNKTATMSDESDARYTEDLVGPGEGATFGAVIGGLTGILASISALAIPGIGPIVAAGPIISGLIGAAAGAATGGLVAGLVHTGVPEEEAQYYAEGIRRGGTLVVVHTTDDRSDAAYNVMGKHNPVDIGRRSQEWRQGGWTGFDDKAQPYEKQDINKMRESARETTSSYTTSERDETPIGGTSPGNVRVYSTNADAAVGTQARVADRTATSVGSQTSLAQTSTSQASGSTSTTSTSTRNTAGKSATQNMMGTAGAATDTQPTSAPTSTADFDTYDNEFRNHYQDNLSNTGYTYDQCRLVYRYG